MHYLHRQYFECNYGGHGLPQRRQVDGDLPRRVTGGHERMTRPAIANMAVYLASDESEITTGQVMRVDSGVTIR